MLILIFIKFIQLVTEKFFLLFLIFLNPNKSITGITSVPIAPTLVAFSTC